MAKAIIARRKGDEYQARFFWLKLLELRTDDHIESVTFESDEAPFVDDVVVSYSEPTKDRLTGEQVVQDFFQCKYHMKPGKAFTYKNLIDPDFIYSKTSMLKRLYQAYLRISEKLDADTFRLYIVSSWSWNPEDVLAKHCHEEMLTSTFYERGSRTEEGKVRLELLGHLSESEPISEEELRAFLSTVRFMLGKNLTDLEREMRLLLKLAGLQPIDPAVTHIVYDDLPWKLFGQGQHSFDKEAFDRVINDEKLKAPPSTEHSEISIQSFSQFARRPRDLQAAHLDLRQFFDGRFPKDESYWKKDIPEQISAFMLNEKLIELPQPIHFFFDCHLGIAFLAGSMISLKHSIEIIPTQKKGNDYTLWKPDSTNADISLWNIQTAGKIGEELVVAISVTHEIQKHMEPYRQANALNNLSQIVASPTGGLGHHAISDGNHAWQLGYQLAKQLREILPNTCRKIHLFFAVPVALGYILGHMLRHIVPVIQLYEHDFEGLRYKDRYYPSLQIPYQP
ncbi:hypothetical protein C6499_05870 [Candidatus Poribacteria bacterium]|nr:MAG: hypothetical protein C6499_05870 [Candidatus Poribacteria bacterium]